MNGKETNEEGFCTLKLNKRDYSFAKEEEEEEDDEEHVHTNRGDMNMA